MRHKSTSAVSIAAIIPFIVLCIFILFIGITIINLSKSEDYQPLTISRIHIGKTSGKLTKANSYISTFRAHNNNLGTVSFRFNTTKQTKSGLLLFRLKEYNAKTWYYENTYRTDQFMNDGLFPFGFPPIPNSMGKIYHVELLFQAGTNNNYLVVSNPQFVTKYAYTRGDLHSAKDILTILMIKVESVLSNMSFLDYIITVSPLIIYLLLMRYRSNYLEWFNLRWITFLQDMMNSISLVHLGRWLRRYELATVLVFISLFFNSMLYIKNVGQSIKWAMLTITVILLIFLSRKIIVLSISFLKQVGLIIALLIHIAIKTTVFHTIPNWDGSLYFYWINDQITAFNINFSNYGEKFSLFGHPSQGYMSYLAIGRALYGYSYLSIHMLNTLLGFATICAFYVIIKKVYRFKPIDLSLFTILFAVNPLFVANSLTPNLDYPVICFFAIALSLLLYDKLIISTFFWILLAFSKETGLLLYGLFILFECVTLLFGRSLIFSMYVSRLKQQSHHLFTLLFGYLLYLALPVLIFIFNYFMRSQRVWQPNYYVLPHNPIVVNYEIIYTRFVESFLLNFQWILLLLMIAGIIKSRKMLAPLSLVLTTISFYIVMAIYNTFLHPRYMVPMHLLFMLIAVPFIDRIFQSRWVKIGCMALIGLLLLVQNYFTADILSMKLLGSFKWGNYTLIKIGDSAQSRCDGFAYNIQHTRIKLLYEDLHKKIGALPYSIIVNDLEDNLQSNRWVQQYGFAPLILIDELKKTVPEGNVYYVFLPWLTNNRDLGLAEIKKYYQVGKGTTLNHNGYWLRYYKLQKLTK